MNRHLVSDMQVYWIAFTMRSGSTLLCDYLSANGFGQPTEYFQYPFGVANKWHYDQLGVSPDDFQGYLRELVRQRSMNGIFGAKIAWNQKNALLEAIQLIRPDTRDLRDLFPSANWIYLRRRDKIAQAISIWRAAITGRWHAQDASSFNPVPEYEFSQILSFLSLILVEEYLWQDYFKHQNLQPLTLFYEDLIARPLDVLFPLMIRLQGQRRIIAGKADIKLNTRLVRLSDQHSESIKARFLQDLYHVGALNYWESTLTPRSSLAEWTAQSWLDFFSGQKTP